MVQRHQLLDVLPFGCDTQRALVVHPMYRTMFRRPGGIPSVHNVLVMRGDVQRHLSQQGRPTDRLAFSFLNRGSYGRSWLSVRDACHAGLDHSGSGLV